MIPQHRAFVRPEDHVRAVIGLYQLLRTFGRVALVEPADAVASGLEEPGRSRLARIGRRRIDACLTGHRWRGRRPDRISRQAEPRALDGMPTPPAQAVV